MREIKFRAWDEYDNKMYKKQAVDEDGYAVDINGDEAYSNEPGRVLMQYTGLKDKNGVEIYEGDILGGYYEETYDDYWFCGFVVEFRNGAFRCVKGIDVKIDLGYQDGFQEYADSQFDFIEEAYIKQFQCEVIGNIYENKNLLEETK
jgi:uncharacterized phage protein (TIGR01671 family)